MTPQEAHERLMKAACELDRLTYGSDLEPWKRYQQAYFDYVEAVRNAA